MVASRFLLAVACLLLVLGSVTRSTDAGPYSPNVKLPSERFSRSNAGQADAMDADADADADVDMDADSRLQLRRACGTHEPGPLQEASNQKLALILADKKAKLTRGDRDVSVSSSRPVPVRRCL